MASCDVLIAGAGPTGLVLALWLTRQGVAVRIIDKTAEAGTTSRALAVQARTLELYRQLDLADEVVRRGHKTGGVNFWARGEKAAHVPLGDIGEGLTPFSFMLTFPQDQHEKLLIERLALLGVDVERQTELVDFQGGPEGVTARLRTADGGETTCRARYLAGCDGARSVVRKAIGADFPGGTYRQLFYVADVEGTGPAFDGELHVDLDEADFLAIFPIGNAGRGRLIGLVRDERAAQAETLQFDDVSAQAIAQMKLEVTKVNWFSTYHVHHRVADRFRKGRAFIIGDAAHIHSPAGGQGMNTGIGDAINLAWKLAAVIGGRAPEALLESYEAERIGFARKLVSTTDKAFSLATAEGAVAGLVRTRLFPMVVPTAMRIEAVREFAFRTVGQLAVNYREGPLSAGRAGEVEGGDRLPWAPVGAGDNFAGLTAIAWQAHVYGTASPELSQWCAGQGVVLQVFPWSEAYGAAGLARDAAYLLRPDSYVAVAEPSGRPEALAAYMAQRGIRPLSGSRTAR